MALKIRTWSLIAVLSAIVPLTMLFIFALVHISTKEQALVEAELRFRTSQIAQTTNEHLAVGVQALLVLSQSVNARKGDWPALYDQARQLVDTNPEFIAAALVNDAGEQLFITTEPYDHRPVTAPHPELGRQVFASGKPNVSGPFEAPAFRGYLIAISVPIISHDKVTHALRMILSTDSLVELLKAQELPSGWLAGIVDPEGTIVARSVAPEQYVGRPASSSFIAATKRKDGKIYQGATLDGVPITSVIYPVFHGDLYASIAVPDPVLKSESRHTLLLMFLLSVGAAAVGLGIAFVSSQFIARQTRQLTRVVGARENQAGTSTPPVGISEFSGLYHSFLDIVASEERIADHLKSITVEKNEIRDLYDQAPCGYHSLDPNGCFVRINQTELNWLGRSADEVIGQPFKRFITDAGKDLFDHLFPQFLAQGHIEELEFALVHADGSTRPVLVNATLIRDANGKPVMSRSIVFDITERKKLEHRLEELSNSDAMTGLCNRRHFYELASNEIARANRLQSSFSLAILDVDHFKRVNDEFGHAIGDELLISLAQTLKAKMRSIDIVARIGGEEFAILMPHTDLTNALTVMDRLREELAESTIPLSDGRLVRFTVSIGVTAQQGNEFDIDAMLVRADKALYTAKGSGRNRVCA